jgi:hypothetical protein
MIGFDTGYSFFDRRYDVCLALVFVVQNDGWTPLHVASHDGRAGILPLLLDGGAPIDQVMVRVWLAHAPSRVRLLGLSMCADTSCPRACELVFSPQTDPRPCTWPPRTDTRTRCGSSSSGAQT